MSALSRMNLRPKFKPSLRVLLILVMLIWASSFIFIKWGLMELKPFNLAFWRFLIATPILFSYVFLTKKEELMRFSKKDLLPLVVLGLSGVSLLYAVQFLALKYTTAINGSILINSAVLFIVVFSFAFLGEKLTETRTAGTIIGIFGITIVLSNGNLAFLSTDTFLGDLLMIFDGFLWAIYTIAGKILISDRDGDAVTAWAFVFGTLTLLPFLHYEGLQIPMLLTTWVSVLFLSVLCSFFAYIVWYRAIAVEDASKISIYIYLVPFFTAIMAVAFLDESLTISKAVGGFLTILGIYLAERS